MIDWNHSTLGRGTVDNTIFNDCNCNGVLDSCDIDQSASRDANGNGIPDECESDCNGNGVPDGCDVSLGNSTDCNGNNILDECEVGTQIVEVEVFVEAPLEVVEERDTKGLYKKARSGEIKNFTGVSDPYEAPENAEVVVHTGSESIEESGAKVLDYLVGKGLVAAAAKATA